MEPLDRPAAGEPGDEFITLIRGGAVGALGYLFLLPQPTDLRLPLVVLPFAAIGVARGISLARHPRGMAISTPKRLDVYGAAVEPELVAT
jgi:hypothetical protein